MLLTAPKNWLQEMVKLSPPKTKFGKMLAAENPPEEMDKECERLKAAGVKDIYVLIAYMTVGPLLAENLMIEEYKEQNPMIQPIAPEVLDYRDALMIAEKDNQMLTEKQLDELLSLLKTDKLMRPLKEEN